MKTIGLIGGTTWISTLEYYRIINEVINEKIGGLHSAHCILYSVDFDEFIIKHEGKWMEIAQSYINIAKKLEISGADFLVICANTIHKIADEIQKNINIPLLHIVDTTGEKIIEKGLKKIGLLGTKYTMEEEFFKKRLKYKFNIETVIPEDKEIEIVHNIIFNELTYGIIRKSSKQKYLKIINNLIINRAEGIILGCTELPMIIKKNDVKVPIFDTMEIHANAAAKYALQ